MTELQKTLFTLQDEKYRDFNAGLIPNIPKEKVIGVRIPALRQLAKELHGTPTAAKFMVELPHEYHEENCLHGFLIEHIKDFDRCIEALESFLPYVDNWAVCDGMNPKVLGKNHESLIKYILLWLKSAHTYTVRYGIGQLMRYYLDENFKDEYLSLVAGVQSQEYYVKMMQAWYFATALAKQYDSAIVYLQQRSLDPWVHSKTIQKAIESYRISDDVKEYLKGLRQ